MLLWDQGPDCLLLWDQGPDFPPLPHIVIFSARSRNESPGIFISLSEAADTGASQSAPRIHVPPGTAAVDSLGTRLMAAVAG